MCPPLGLTKNRYNWPNLDNLNIKKLIIIIMDYNTLNKSKSMSQSIVMYEYMYIHVYVYVERPPSFLFYRKMLTINYRRKDRIKKSQCYNPQFNSWSCEDYVNGYNTFCRKVVENRIHTWSQRISS